MCLASLLAEPLGFWQQDQNASPPRLGAENGVRIVTPKMVPRGFFPGKNTRAGIKNGTSFSVPDREGEYFKATAMWNWAAWLQGTVRRTSAWFA